jgi:hypothetical protein
MDEDQERTVGLLLLGKGSVLAHGSLVPLAAEMDEYEQRPTRDGVGGTATPLTASASLDCHAVVCPPVALA